MRTTTHRAAVAGAVMALALLLAGCGGEDSAQSAGGAGNLAQQAPGATPTPGATPAPGGNTIGAGCAMIPASGPGSFQAMSTSTLGDAIASSEQLSAFSQQLEQAGLTETLNSETDITVFAPTNEAFGVTGTPAPTPTPIPGGAEQLQYHVVDGVLTPDNIEGEHETLAGGTITVTRDGDTVMVNETATVECGNIQTQNGTLYIIDEVLTPTAAPSPSPSP